jgi:hypothetical protein
MKSKRFLLALLLFVSVPVLAQVRDEVSQPGENPRYRDFTGQSSAPASPATGKFRVYLDASGNLKVKNAAGTVTAIGAVAGSNTQVIYNSSGAYAGSANLTFDGTTLFAAQLKVNAGAWITDSGNRQRIYFLSNDRTYIKGHGTTILDVQNGADTSVFTVSNTGAITSSALTNGRVPIVSTGGLITDDDSFLFDATNNRLAIGGTSAPSQTLDVLSGNIRIVSGNLILANGNGIIDATSNFQKYQLSSVNGLQLFTGSGSSTERMRIDTSGIGWFGSSLTTAQFNIVSQATSRPAALFQAASGESPSAANIVNKDGAGGTTFTVRVDGGITFNKTLTAAGTTGDRTINRPMFSVNFAAAASSLTVTNSLISTTSVLTCQVQTNDSTLKSVVAVPGSGSVVLTGNAAATAETVVACVVFN